MEQWSEVVCVNDEADFMARLFPNSNNLGVHYTHIESNNYNQNDNANCYQQTSYRNPNIVGYYQMDHFSDNRHNNDHANIVAVAPSGNNASAMAIDFLQGHVEDDNEVKERADIKSDNLEVSPDDNEAVEDIKSSDNSSENSRKRPKLSDIPKGKRNVKAKQDPKLTLGGGDDNEDENGARIIRQNSSSWSLEDDCSSKGTNTTALNSNGKTRASRGSATDPQSLYARKRRERINERLKILQTLVPNGTKVDISTMLEEAVNYVKFLQLQIKLLSSDEMWMYAPIAYNGMNLGLDFNNITIPK